jgi:hypothetical protein
VGSCGDSPETTARHSNDLVSRVVSSVSSPRPTVVSAWRRLRARFNSSTASSRASGGHAATEMANTLGSGVAVTLAHKERQIPNKNESQADHRPPLRLPAPWPVFHYSTVAIVNRPSTINGQIVAVVVSAPNRKAKSRPFRYEAYAAPNDHQCHAAALYPQGAIATSWLCGVHRSPPTCRPASISALASSAHRPTQACTWKPVHEQPTGTAATRT